MDQSKYKAIANEIRDKIASGEYVVNTCIPSELELQQKYQVSRHTIRQATSLLVNEGLLRRGKGFGTIVNAKFVNEKSAYYSREKVIGVILTSLSNYIFPSIISGLETALKKRGYSFLLASTDSDYTQERKCIESMLDHDVAGLIVEPTASNKPNPNLDLYIQLRGRQFPLVMINAAYEEVDFAAIHVDDVKSGFLSAEYLIKNNHKNIMLITKIDDLQGKYRMKGFIQACSKYKVPLLFHNVFTYETGDRTQVIENAVRYLKKNKCITGIVCYNDEIASLLIEKFSSLNKTIPLEFSIIGHDNSDLSRKGKVKITTIEHPKEKMGIDSANWIIDTIEAGTAGNSITYEPILIKGDTVTTLF